MGKAIPYDWARVQCPTCGAEPDMRCRAKSGRITDAHSKRIWEGSYYSEELFTEARHE